MEAQQQRAIRGALIGTAVGDALGLPAEGISRRRIARLYGGVWRHRLLFGRGMISDDTEHTIFVAQALLAHPDDAKAFARRLARSLRWWFAALPAGIGMATLRAILKLWLGFPPERSGVFSAGNGPAMRAGIIGAFFADTPEKIGPYVRASTRLTHTDPKALTGSLAVARIAAWCALDTSGRPPATEPLRKLLRACGPEDAAWLKLVEQITDAAALNLEVAEFAAELGLNNGVSGYVYHTVPVAIYAWLRHFGDFEASVTGVLECGGDTDTVGAITGAMTGAASGADAIPKAWIKGIADWPRGITLLEKISGRLSRGATGERIKPVPYFVAGVLPRNIFFLVVVLIHGFRRLLPPY